MTENYVFVQRGITGVKLYQVSDGVFMRVNVGDILLDEVTEANRNMVQADIIGCQVGKCLEEEL